MVDDLLGHYGVKLVAPQTVEAHGQSERFSWVCLRSALSHIEPHLAREKGKKWFGGQTSLNILPKTGLSNNILSFHTE